MHDIDRTSLEMNYGEYESDAYEYEYEENEEYEGETYGESPFSEAEEMELAAELLSVASEEELDQFIGKLFKKAGRAIGKFIKSPIGKTLGGIVKGAVKNALPTIGGAIGNFVLPGAGGAIGSQLASRAGSMLGLELEGLSQEDQEFEIARQIVRFGGAAASNAAESETAAPPQQAAQAAAVSAAQQYAPGLLRPGAGQAATGRGRCRHPQGGRWVRKGNAIILFGV